MPVATDCTSFQDIPASSRALRTASTPMSTKCLSNLPQGCMPTPSMATSRMAPSLSLVRHQPELPGLDLLPRFIDVELLNDQFRGYAGAKLLRPATRDDADDGKALGQIDGTDHPRARVIGPEHGRPRGVQDRV